MTDILTLTAPIYLLILLGWLSVRLGWFARADMRVLGQFVVRIALPALLFRTLASQPLAKALDWRLLLAYASASALCFALARRGAQGRLTPPGDQPAAWPTVLGLGVAFSNSGFIGAPVLLQWLGPQAGGALAVSLVVENLVMLPLFLAFGDQATATASRTHSMMRSLKPLARSPLVLAILAGAVVGGLNTSGGNPLPTVLAKGVDLLANASAGVALLVIGGSLAGQPRPRLSGPLLALVGGKLLLHPLMVLALVLWWVPAGTPLMAPVVALAAMPMASIYPVLAQKHGFDGFCAAALLVTTSASFLTLSAWLWLLQGPLARTLGLG